MIWTATWMPCSESWTTNLEGWGFPALINQMGKADAVP